MIRAIWISNIILPDYASEFGVKQTPYGGWISAMLNAVDNKIEIALVFPINDLKKMRDGVHNGHKYYSVPSHIETKFEISKSNIERFREIITDFSPDLIHIWGSEYAWCCEMVEACKSMNYLHRTIISIQGLISVCARHYLKGVTSEYIDMFSEKGLSIRDEQESFKNRGINEKQAISNILNILGRTEWDKACVTAINPSINYFHCREIMRNEIYDSAGSWSISKCTKHRIFISQASYPIKGFHYLLKALPYVLSDYPDTKVFVGGANIIVEKNKAYGKFITDEIDRLNLNEKIFFLGPLTAYEMIEQYRRANVFVSPSLIENSSNSIMEAQIVGTPVISSFVGGVSSYLSQMNNSLLYPVDEFELLAEMIKKLFGNPELCINLSQTGQKTGLEFASPQKAVDELIRAYSVITGE